MWVTFNIQDNTKVKVNFNYVKCIKFQENSIDLDGVEINITILREYNEDFDYILWKLKNMGD